ncbi:AAA family ATPase [Gorillibacterium massiliense]|uniref:AAA family ATPase n=1 Tax=Gorillibacterium massiliense TaxID=1280390 RepID=UPI0004B53058|nr:MoxR family ATPase [Gorillibacterium massiliense]
MEGNRKADLEIVQRLQNNLESCILGKREEIKLLLTALLAGGHVLLEDVPGTGKTVLIKALARSIKGQYRRIQCNPDLLPTDITGVSIYHPKMESFVFRPGPVMTNILLTDEINRATTKTQSALLEAMEEHHVTVDGELYELPEPFLLLATQNPIDFEGTYVLPEAQLDRFMLKFSLGYPDEATEYRMLVSQSKVHPVETLEPVADTEQILALQQKVHDIYLEEEVGKYIVNIVRKTREHPSIFLGASPRSTLALTHAAKAYAFIQGRDFVLPDDVKTLVPPILGHRILLHSEARLEGMTVSSALRSVMEQVKVPVRMQR